jgi:hypothetical protein
MITADKVKTLIEFSPKELAVILDKSGYRGASFKTAQFVGITNGGQFAYKVTYFDKENTGKDEVGKVFVTYDRGTDSIVADY